MNRNIVFGLIGLVMLGGLALITVPMLGGRGPDADSTTSCGPGLTRSELDESLALGSAHMLAAQRPEGNFGYEWNWISGADNPDDNEVRQAGSTWGLALILHDDPQRADVRDGLLRALDFWDTQAVDDGEHRWLFYKNSPTGSTGTLALVTLAVIELLRTDGPLPEGRREDLDGQLDRLLAAIAAQRAPGGGFASSYQADGTPFAAPNPYADGEALLAMVKAGRYLGRTASLNAAASWAVDDRMRNVELPRRTDPDPDKTKGYYQWVSMAWYELEGSAVAPQHPWGEWLMELAVWMIDDHRTLSRTRNTAYAYEGIVSAWAHAKAVGDPRADKFRCVIDRGMHKLTSWQIGHSLANDFARKASPNDARARGGVMNEARKAPLRIDVAQHQMHAVILARRYGVGR